MPAHTFLEHVAADILAKHGTNLSRTAVVFPNKRAALFMNEYLARITDRPMWSPAYITISDLFRRHSDLQVGDPIQLICILHRIFTETTGINETLDQFYGWGQMLLADFDDIDKNMADPRQVFANLQDLHGLDTTAYLTEEQKSLLQRFFKNFTNESESILKERFLRLWSRFYEIYCNYNEALRQKGIAYEGALYREVAENEGLRFEYDRYIFVGFNVLQQVEQRLFTRLKNSGKAHFYWDYDNYYKDNINNEAGHYIRQHLQLFPNELQDTDGSVFQCFSKPKDISYISAQTDNAQARFVSQWLRQNGRIEAGRKTAIVLCDESLLPNVIHCLPPEVEKVNITTGYPLSLSPFSTLTDLLIELQTTGHCNGTDKYKLRQVLRVLRHPYAPLITQSCQQLAKQLSEEHTLFPSRQALAADEGAALLFKDISQGGEDPNASLLGYLLDILQLIGTPPSSISSPRGGREGVSPLFQESLFRTYTLLNRLRELIIQGDLQVQLNTLLRLIGQLVSSTSIPFHGEPAEGLQVMGVLETRNLDFDHVLILSCNEGNMPKGVNDTSFIPYAIRKAYNLTTIDNKVSVYAYYFNRLLQRAEDVAIVYNNATEEGRTGQMSRFMLQLLVESSHKISLQSLTSTLLPHTSSLQPPLGSVGTESPIPKDPAVMSLLKNVRSLSPSAINRYLRCQLQFYYNLLAGLKEPDQNDEDEIDNRIFGNIFHRSAELIYTPFASSGQLVKKRDLQEILKNRHYIERLVDQAFKEELFKTKSNSFTPEYNGLQMINREVIISYLEQMLKIDLQLAPFTIIKVEHQAYTTFQLPSTQLPSTQLPSPRGGREGASLSIGGIIDRIDRISHPESGDLIRVVDYKTGKVASQAIYDIDDIFSGTNISQKHADYYLQALLYADIVRQSAVLNPGSLPVAPALLFIQHAAKDGYDPILTIGSGRDKKAISDIKDYEEDFRNRLTMLLEEIFNPAIPFQPTGDMQRCESCPYRKICNI